MKAQRIGRTAIVGVVAGVLAAGLVIAPASQAASTIKIGYLNATIGPFAGGAPQITIGLNIALKEIKSTVAGKRSLLLKKQRTQLHS